jgi:RNA polymerase sigma factor (sigma-70 family)
MNKKPLGIALSYLRQVTAGHSGALQDQELLQRFSADHDEDAFAKLVQRHGPLVLGVCRRVLHNEHDAEDVFQATFLVLARHAASIRQRDYLSSWLYKVAFHLAVKLRANLARRRRQETRDQVVGADPLADVSWKELQGVLDDELQRLPEKYRVALLLCCLAGKTRDEAALQLGWTLGTLKRRLERGRNLLRTRLARRGLTVSASLLAMAMAQQATAAALPVKLLASIARAGLLYAGKRPVEGVSSQAISLAEIGLPSLGVGKLHFAMMALVALGLAGLAAGLLLSERHEKPQPALPASAGAASANGRFADSSRESGLAEILDRHYAAFPDSWLAGMDLLDLAGDGHLDLLLGIPGGTAAAAYNDGKGHFHYIDPRPSIPRGMNHKADLPFPGGGIRLAHDFNEDGKLDLHVYWHNFGAATYFNTTRRGSPPSFQFKRAPFLDEGYHDVRTCAIADLNRDGIADFLYSTSGSDLFCHHGKGDGSFTPKPSFVLPTGVLTPGAIPVDLHGKGYLDLICRQTEFDVGARSRIFRNNGDMTFTDVTREAGLPQTGLSVLGVGDVNQDGHLDLICMEGQNIVIYLNDGKGHFTRKLNAVRGLERAANKPSATYPCLWGGAVVTDFDNDGIPDIIISGKFFLYVLRGTGGGNFEYANDLWGIPSLAYCGVDDGICFGDVNGDGRLDLILATDHPDTKQRRVGLFLNRLTDHHWLRLQLVGKKGNRAATSAKIRIYEAGSLNDPAKLLWYEQVAVWGRQSFHSYYAKANTERHFGLGKRDRVDVSVEFYPSGKLVEQRNVPADTITTLYENSSPAPLASVSRPRD